ncbi:glutamate 5-kinase [Jongsikchunia kroppenstedtii]|uniref:glutamate 5-kinase n=1 Tax=Jongsikchunia kroppenstedtii TaxID=1121721 RepID=UPI0009DACA64|nr:glutamate 5-kinase [Jongsikchunia kroppenstedtii]
MTDLSAGREARTGDDAELGVVTSPFDSPTRLAIANAKSIVVKIGSSALTDLAEGLDTERLDRLAAALERRMRAGTDVIVVSSGAVGSGVAPLGLKKRPTDLATKQAAASVGQLQLAHAWSTSFGRFDRVVGLVLLTAHDIALRAHHANAQRTLDRLRSLGAVAIVNENDTVATNELRFGDNDRLAAMVAHLAGVDALVLLSDVPGLYDSDPRKSDATFIREVAASDRLDGVSATEGSHIGTGGMASKLSAARLAADSGVPVLMAAAAEVDAALGDASVGTVFEPRPKRLSARKFWLRHAAESSGRIAVDDGARAAIARSRRSLLPAGILSVEGDFASGDVVDVVDSHGGVVARGMVAYDAVELLPLRGKSTDELPQEYRRPVIHADDLVPLH